MFLFESRQQKQTRERVQRSMQICMSNSKKYTQSKDVLVMELRRSDQKVIEMIVDNIKSTIKNEEFQPVRKYQAILLLKDLMLTHNKALGKYVVKKILKRLIILAQHKTVGKGQEREEEQGKDIFGPVKKDQEQYAAKFFNTLLTALQEWGKNWPKASDGPYNSFHKEYNQLLMNGVQFPKVRPKQAPPKQATGRLSREEGRNSVDHGDISQGKSTQKSPPPRPQQTKPKTSIKSNRNNASLKASIVQFYQKIKEPLNLLNEILPICQPQTIPMIRDIVEQFSKNMQIGNDLIISIDDDEQFSIDNMKIKKCFDFQEKIKKDLSIMAKKPEQSEVFKNKYIKLCKQLFDTLNKSSDATVSHISSNSNVVTERSLSPKPKPTVTQKPGEKVEEKPKIINKNRYTSVQGQQVLQNFDKSAYNSKGGESVHSDRFGSFGGPNDRHRASNPFQASSPQIVKKVEGASSDKKEESNRSQRNPPIKAILEQKTIQLSKPQNISKQANRVEEKKEETHQRASLDNIFRQFQIEKPKRESQKGSTSNLQPKFADNDSFGASQFGAKSKIQKQQQDFFAKLEQNEKEPTKGLNTNPRRKKPQQRQDHQDVFKMKIESKIDSSLSGFQFSQKKVDVSKADSRNAPSPINTEEEIKKEKVLENPFQQENFQNKSRNSENFFDQFDRSQRSNLFGNSTVTQKIKTQNDDQEHKVSQKHFQTGNFGNMISSKPAPLNPFDEQSIKSKKQFNSNENPFGNDSFDRINKSVKEQNKSIHSNKVGNPFQSKILQPNQAIFQSNAINSINAVNPFENSSQKSHKSKNAFDEVQQYFKPPSKPNIEDLSQRGSFKKINGQTQIIRQNFANNHLQEPIRDSLVFSAKIGRESEQNGLNFSQFEDIVGPQANAAANPFAESSELGRSNPFNQSGESKKKQEFSGFSLSNFPGLGDTQKKIEKNKQNPNNSVADFFGNYENESITNKISIDKKAEPKQKVNFFDEFNIDSSLTHQKFQNRKSTQNIPNNHIDRQKTVLSGQQKSFNFQQLEQSSAIQKKRQIKKEEFEESNPIHNTSRIKRDKDGFAIENQNQKSIGWSDFDPELDKSQLDKVENQKPGSERMLEVQSRLRHNPNSNPDRQKINEVSLANSKASKNMQQNSININLQDFAPISKKGIQWNPLSKLSNLKPSPFTYSIIEDKQMQTKRHQLIEKQREYAQKLQIFKFARHKNDEIRNIYVLKMKKLEEVVEQKGEYMQMLKKIKETNDMKEKQIEVLHQKLKKAQELKEKILQKQRQFYEITKNQNYPEQKKNANQRSMANKWQMFNKNLQNNRNSITSMHSQYSHYY